jgi:DtxR family Mn-dependent transcriptional regulator
VRLSDAEPGHPLVVSRISDADPALLRYVAEKGVVLDVRLTVDEHRTFAGDVAVRLGERGDAVELGQRASDAVWVTRAGA